MKYCNSEVMKMLKSISREMTQLQSANTVVNYYIGEPDYKDETTFDLADTIAKIEKLQAKERLLKHELAKANATVIVPEFGMTIGECLVYLAQLVNRQKYYDGLAGTKRTVRTVYGRNDGCVTKTLYNVDDAKELASKNAMEISRLQIAIDRVNLNNIIEIDF